MKSIIKISLVFTLILIGLSGNAQKNDNKSSIEVMMFLNGMIYRDRREWEENSIAVFYNFDVIVDENGEERFVLYLRENNSLEEDIKS